MYCWECLKKIETFLVKHIYYVRNSLNTDHILWKSFIIGKHCGHIFVTTVMENENISSFFINN